MVLVASPSDFVIRLVRWHPCGHDRLYVNAADGQQLGWHDLAHKGCASRGSNSQPAGANHALAAAVAVAPGAVARVSEAGDAEQGAGPDGGEQVGVVLGGAGLSASHDA